MNDSQSIEITVNGQVRAVPLETTIRSLLATTEMLGTSLAVEVNEEVVPRERHATHVMRAGDRVEIVTLVGGG